MPEVSIIIVCMNNMSNIRRCLDSIRKYTHISYEILVVAYMFTEDNLKLLRSEYPWITIIESKEIRGFSENNNLALRQAKGRYCMVLNDDTELRMPVIDDLVKTIEELPENVAVVSPCTCWPNGGVQYCGRQERNWRRNILGLLGLWNEQRPSPYINKLGVFKSYNLCGAAFLIKTEVFREVGWLDERYFFSPEDLALGTLLNERGYECWVNSELGVVHYMGGSSSNFIITALKPQMQRGNIIFNTRDKQPIKFITELVTFIMLIPRFCYHRYRGLKTPLLNRDYVLSIADLHCMAVCFTNKLPKDIFLKYYNRFPYYKNKYRKYLNK